MKDSLFKRKAWATGIGSLPFLSPQQACDFILEVLCDEIPFWPQLPRRSFHENMYVQFSQGLPGVVVDAQQRKIYVDTASKRFDAELESCYQHYLSEDLDYFAIGPDYAAGLHVLSTINHQPSTIGWFKGQVTGPISFGLTVTDERKRSIIYHSELSEALVKLLIMKTKWQIRKLREINSDFNIIIFIDEPYLVSIGSSFVNLDRQDVINKINSLTQAIHLQGAKAGIHCCGNTDWIIPLSCDIDVLSFDAYNYLDKLLLYERDLKRFLKNGGILAWGIVPTSQQLNSETVDSLLKRLEELNGLVKNLPAHIITPSCGCGSLPIELAKRVIATTAKISLRLNPS
jgi:hypothetical protein